MPLQGSPLPGGAAPASWRRRLLPLLMATALASQAQAADLLTITRDALENSAELASSRSVYKSVEASREIERADLLPQVGASVNVAHNRTYQSQIGTDRRRPGGGATGAGEAGASGSAGDTDDYNTISAGVELTQALFDATDWYQLQQADEQLGQQALLLEGDRQQLLYEVVEAYFEILLARDVLAARVAQEKAIQRQLKQSREQFEVGLIAITDVHEAQAAADQARARRIAAASNLQVSFEALERLTGQRYETIEGLSEELPIEPPQPRVRDAWVTLAMKHSPALRASRKAVEVAARAVEVAQADHLPTLEAYAQYTYSDTDIGKLHGYNSDSKIGLSASLPIFTGGRTRARVDQQTYLLESSQYAFENQRRITIQQVRSLFTRVVNDVQTVEVQRQAILSNRSALEATRSGYEVGTRNVVDVLNAQQNLYNALSDYAEARYVYVIDLIALRRQAGVLDTRDIRALNEWLRAADAVSLALPEDQGGNDFDAALEIGAPPQPPPT